MGVRDTLDNAERKKWIGSCFPSAATYISSGPQSGVALQTKLALYRNQVSADFTSLAPIDQKRPLAGKTSKVQCFFVCECEKVVE